MQQFQVVDSNTFSTLTTIVVIIIVVLVIIALLRFFTRTTELLGVVTLLVTAIGEFVGSSRLVWLGCGVLVLICLGCSAAGLLTLLAMGTCGTPQPVQLCRLLGR